MTRTTEQLRERIRGLEITLQHKNWEAVKADLECLKELLYLREARPYGYLRENDGQVQISIGPERPPNRSGGYATPWGAIYAAPPAPAVSAGFKLVPIEPTPEMIAATEVDGDEYYFDSDEAAETWMANKFKAMLAAAPTPTK